MAARTRFVPLLCRLGLHKWYYIVSCTEFVNDKILCSRCNTARD